MCLNTYFPPHIKGGGGNANKSQTANMSPEGANKLALLFTDAKAPLSIPQLNFVLASPERTDCIFV